MPSRRKPKKPKGPGSKSGTNRHKDGASDDKIGTLSKAQKEMEDLKPASVVEKETEQEESKEQTNRLSEADKLLAI